MSSEVCEAAEEVGQPGVSFFEVEWLVAPLSMVVSMTCSSASVIPDPLASAILFPQ